MLTLDLQFEPDSHWSFSIVDCVKIIQTNQCKGEFDCQSISIFMICFISSNRLPDSKENCVFAFDSHVLLNAILFFLYLHVRRLFFSRF